MKIALLETGRPSKSLRERFGGYGEMFERLLAAPGRAFVRVDATGPLPASDAFDAYLVTGSAAGVYDPLPWIAPLQAFLREVRGRAPLVGVCFGHQVMAEAFGGRVVKSPKGRGTGLQSYGVQASASWMDAVDSIAVPAAHGDQVVELAPGARVLAGNEFCPYALLDYGDAVSIQPHPEFTPAFAKALIEGGWEALDEAHDRASLASLDQPNDCARVGGWIGRFLES